MKIYIAFAPGTPVPLSTIEIENCVEKELSLESHGGEKQALVALELLDSLIEGILTREFSQVAWIYFAMILGKHSESRYFRSKEKRIMEGLLFVRSGLNCELSLATPPEVANALARSFLSQITSTLELPIKELTDVGLRTENWDTQYFLELIMHADGSHLSVDRLVRDLEDAREFFIYLDLLPRSTDEEQAIFDYYLLAVVEILIDLLDGQELDFELDELYRFVWEELLSTLVENRNRHLIAQLITYVSYAAVGKLVASGAVVATRALMVCPRESLEFFQKR